MSRRGRVPAEVCADCGAADPSWASTNRGILLCPECCSVHRSMGRHISCVKSLHQGTWPPTLLSMINAMTVQNVNAIWEHSLLDPSSKHSKKKPQPKDPLGSVKSEFIKAKHERLAYSFRPRKDDIVCGPTELSRQLHSSVRSANLDTSLRLLVQGADPSYFDREKGTTCLHVACRTGNSSQAELLVAWGADPNAKDINGNTPSASARLGGHNELADRMLELVYEVTDRLSYHLCNKKPNHKNGQHFISLEKKESHELTDVAKTARGKLQLLPNHLFEELVMDIYEEVDRRECEAVWVTSAIGLERYGVAFLPVNPSLSAPRNQGRQKLARLSTTEMAALLRDILMDANRRQHIATLQPSSFASGLYKENLKPTFLKHVPHISDDEPLYDSVASDEDYAALIPGLPHDSSDKVIRRKSRNESILTDHNSIVGSANAIIGSDRAKDALDAAKSREIELLRDQLTMKDFTIAELTTKLEHLQAAVENLTAENATLKRSVEKKMNVPSINSPPISRELCVAEDSNKTCVDNKLQRGSQRPTSMYETRERSKLNWPMMKHQFIHNEKNDDSFQENLCNAVTVNNVPISIPASAEVHKYTEVVTKGIQELWGAMQDPAGQGYSFGIKANKIKMAVEQLISIFPKKSNDKISSALCQLSSSCKHLETICIRWNMDDELLDADLSMDDIRAAAYELAKATKILVSNFPLNPDN